MMYFICVLLVVFSLRVYYIEKMLEKESKFIEIEIDFWKAVFSFKKCKIYNFISIGRYCQINGNITNEMRVVILKDVKKRFLKGNSKCICNGLCVYLVNVAIDEHKFPHQTMVKLMFPEFNAKFLGGDPTSKYWWPRSKDRTTRIEALNKLIKLYS